MATGHLVAPKLFPHLVAEVMDCLGTAAILAAENSTTGRDAR